MTLWYNDLTAAIQAGSLTRAEDESVFTENMSQSRQDEFQRT